LGCDDAGSDEAWDLVVVTLPAVQRFVEEARTTSDVVSASAIYSALAAGAVAALQRQPGCDLVLPAAPGNPVSDSQAVPDSQGTPNRVVARFPGGTGATAASAASTAVHDAWRGWLRRTLVLRDGDPLALVRWLRLLRRRRLAVEDILDGGGFERAVEPEAEGFLVGAGLDSFA
jgi:hypothetical protein